MEAGRPVVKTVTGEDRLIDRPRVTIRTAKLAVVPLNNRLVVWILGFMYHYEKLFVFFFILSYLFYA